MRDGKHKPLSPDTHKYRTTFTSTTKIVHWFSRRQLRCGSLAAARWRRQLGGGSGSMAAAARWRWRKWWQRVAMVEATVTGWRRQLSSNARHANVRTFVLGQRWRDNGADYIIVGKSGARGNVHHGRRGTDKAKGDADDTMC